MQKYWYVFPYSTGPKTTVRPVVNANMSGNPYLLLMYREI